MNGLQGYIPQSKHDTHLIEELSRHAYPYYRPILKGLFEWIQDINWPVARRIVPLLVNAGTDVIPVVREILDSGDTLWIYWTLNMILDDFRLTDAATIIQALQPQLCQKMLHPSDEERADEIDGVIRELFTKFNISPQSID